MSDHAIGWRKSTRSNQHVNCVEVGRTSTGAALRDTKDRDGGTLAFGHAQWAAFVSTVKSGHLDG